MSNDIPPPGFFDDFDGTSPAKLVVLPGGRKRAKVRNAEVVDGKIPLTFEAHDLHGTVRGITAALPSLTGAYAMHRRLVRIADDGTITPYSDASLLHDLTAGTTFMQQKADGSCVPKLPGERATTALLGLGEWPGVREVERVRRAPCLLARGAVHAGGYRDKVLVLARRMDVDVPDAPTQADARVAAARLLDVVRDFPLSDEGRAAWLALVLTLAGRPAVAGNVPMWVIDGNQPGVGKTLLVQLACEIGLWRGPHIMARPEGAEGAKAFFAALASGAEAACIDNVRGEPLADETLEALLTSPAITMRRMHSQLQDTIPSSCVWTVTGNGVRISSDLARRSILVRLRSRVERPEDRSFPGDILDEVRVRAWECLGYALTILRAWHVTGAKAPHVWGSFEAWGQLVDGAVVHAGLPSVILARRADRDESDAGRDSLGAFLAMLAANHPEGATAAKLVDTYPATPSPTDTEKTFEGRAVLEAIAGPRYGARSVGYALRALKDRSVGGRTLTATKNRTQVVVWSCFFGEEPKTSHASHASPAPHPACDACDAGHVSNYPPKNTNAPETQ